MLVMVRLVMFTLKIFVPEKGAGTASLPPRFGPCRNQGLGYSGNPWFLDGHSSDFKLFVLAAITLIIIAVTTASASSVSLVTLTFVNCLVGVRLHLGVFKSWNVTQTSTIILPFGFDKKSEFLGFASKRRVGVWPVAILICPVLFSKTFAGFLGEHIQPT